MSIQRFSLLTVVAAVVILVLAGRGIRLAAEPGLCGVPEQRANSREVRGTPAFGGGSLSASLTNATRMGRGQPRSDEEMEDQDEAEARMLAALGEGIRFCSLTEEPAEESDSPLLAEIKDSEIVRVSYEEEKSAPSEEASFGKKYGNTLSIAAAEEESDEEILASTLELAPFEPRSEAASERAPAPRFAASRKPRSSSNPLRAAPRSDRAKGNPLR